MRVEVPSRVEMQEKKRTRGDRERGMQGDMPGIQCRRGRGGEEKTAGNRKR